MPLRHSAGRAPLRWQLLPTLVDDGPRNMALDDAMGTRARSAGVALARIYGWNQPTLSFGRHQRTVGYYDPLAARQRGIAIVRRPTGGRAVLHAREITYCVAAPERDLGSLMVAYRTINEILVDALRQMGVDAHVAAPSTRPPKPVAGACFEEPVAGEIVARGRKLVGSAQWRSEGALIQHGSILVDDDQGMASDLMRQPGAPPPRAATLRALLDRAPSLEEFAEAFGCATTRIGFAVENVTLDDELASLADERRAHYASDGWTWRR